MSDNHHSSDNVYCRGKASHQVTKWSESSYHKRRQRSLASCGPVVWNSQPQAECDNSLSLNILHQKLKCASLGNDKHHPTPCSVFLWLWHRDRNVRT